jgi:hypothetical protein
MRGTSFGCANFELLLLLDRIRFLQDLEQTGSSQNIGSIGLWRWPIGITATIVLTFLGSVV